ncbi:MAG: DDE-type integrase/transposase/recombinase [Promethearchaeota archaeon]
MLNYSIEGECEIVLIKNDKHALHERVKEMYYNQELSIEDIALEMNKSTRTIYRWLNLSGQENLPVSQKAKKKKRGTLKYPMEVKNRIIELKKEIPQRSAPLMQRHIKNEFPDNCPSLSLIRKIVREQGLSTKEMTSRQGYLRFQRKIPNDLWQIDISGVQTVAHLKEVYIIALLDDCSRFVVAAQYFRDQLGKHVLGVVRDAILKYGRPNEILADNGSQFKNALGELNTKYSKLLESLGIKHTFARPRHPQTKGKLERWFGTVLQMFLVEARYYVKHHPQCSFPEFNRMYLEWVDWYNMEKPHGGLPKKTTPGTIFFETKDRIFRPLKAKVNWNRWLNEFSTRKVNKYNEIHYKSQLFSVPPGYSGLRVEVIEYEEKLEIYYKETLLITHPYHVVVKPEHTKKSTRKIRKNGTISYKGKPLSIDYKLANKTVEVQESDDGRKLLIYLRGILIKTLNLQ